MTASTTLKLPDDLKTRIASAAAESGKSAHAWMVDAIEAQAALAERRRTFVASALKAEQEVAQYGLVHDADEVFSYIKAKIEGRTAKRPKARKL
ncbi:MAG: hypothetical protein WAO76_11835 [Georgfuchsia sp.]